MMTRAVALAVILTLLLAGAVALAQSDGPAPPAVFTVEQSAASGGGYHLTVLPKPIEASISGGGYRLLVPASPALRGNGCCCVFLPCVLRNPK